MAAYAADVEVELLRDITIAADNCDPTANRTSCHATDRPTHVMKYKLAHRMVGRSRLLRRLTLGLFTRLELLLLKGHKSHTTLNTIRRCRREAESLLTGNEAFLLHSLAQAQSGLDGAMAEVGVYQGSSAQIICEAKGDR